MAGQTLKSSFPEKQIDRILQPKSEILAKSTEEISSETRPSGLVSVDELVKAFNAQKRWTVDLQSKALCLVAELESTQLLLTQAQENNARRNEEVKSVKTVMEQAQAALNMKKELEDGKAKLQDEIERLTKRLIDQKSELEETLVANKREVIELQMAHVKELERQRLAHAQQAAQLRAGHVTELQQLRDELNDNAKQKETEALKTQDEKQQKIEELAKELEKVEKEKLADIAKLKLEYEAKLLKMQKQTVQTPSALSSQHEIFRQKLQHAREESNREVAALKKTIVDLQHRLQQQQQQQQRQQQRENSAGSGFKRLKRY